MTKPNYDLKLQEEFANSLSSLQNNARQRLSPMAWFLLTSALCSLGEPSRTVYPALSHSRTKIEELGPTYKAAYNALTDDQREVIQSLYRRFVSGLSYGVPGPGVID